MLLGSDGSAISEDVHGAVAAAWLVLAVVEASELGNANLVEWAHRINWNQNRTVGGARMCWGNKDERTIMAAEALALLMAMTRIRKALASVQLIVRTVLPIDNQAVVRKFRGVHLLSDAELTNQANADIWIAIRKEKLLWAGEFRVEDIRSHSVDQKVQYLHLSKVEKCTPQQMANWYADKWAKAYLKKMRSKREFVSARPVAIEKGARWRLYHKGALVAGAITKRIKEIVEHNLVQCYFRSKARESSCRLGETKTDHWGLLLDTAVYSAARAKWEL